MEPLQRALADENYETPTPIQALAIPAALAGRDVLGCAQTGTGKTAAFALPILNRLGQHNRKAVPNRPFALILAPTRELAVQIGESFATYGRHLRLRHALVYGGVSQGSQVRALGRGAHIVVATPGRLLDLMNQGHIALDRLETFVLDEVDRMLEVGFLPDLKRIIAHLPRERQSFFFSATLPPKIIELAQRLLTSPFSVDVTPKSTHREMIEQRVLFVERNQKQAMLRNILQTVAVKRALVFTKTKRTANTLSAWLLRNGIKATAIHGNKSQSARQRALESFRRQQVQVLVATDVAARGIDIAGITHVVNFELPVEPEGYVHRIGRTGRAGADGIALSFCSTSERAQLRAIEGFLGKSVPRESTPSLPREEQDAPLKRPGFGGSGSKQASHHRSAGASVEPRRSKRRRPRAKRQGTQSSKETP